MTEFYNGQCLCGKIKFEVKSPTVWTGYCHCQSCRRATGAAAVTHVGITDSSLTFTGETPKIFQSSDGVQRGFCGHCGTPLTYQADHFPAYIQVYLGTFDHPEKLKPQAHVHYAEKIYWYNVDDNLPRFSGSAATENSDWKS